MVDLFGVPISIGDKVIYTTGNQGVQSLEVGTVKTIEGTRAKLISSSNRVLTNWRYQHEIVSAVPIKLQYPELFI